MTDDGSRMYLVSGPTIGNMTEPPRQWTWQTRVEWFRHEFAAGIKSDDELAMFAQIVGLLNEPARVLAELRVEQSDGHAQGLRGQAAVGLEWLAAACVEVAERLREQTT